MAYNNIEILDNSKIINSNVGNSVRLLRSSEIAESDVSDHCVIDDFSKVRYSFLGKYVRIGRNNFIVHSQIGNCSYTGNLDIIMHTKIGKFCSISWGTTIGPGEHDYKRISTHDLIYNDFYKLRNKEDDLPYNRFKKKMEIGDDVWIGCNATLLRGVSIGDGAVVGANSLVKDDVPPYAIVAGNPASIIKYRFSNRIINELIGLKWWDLPFDIIKNNIDLFNQLNIEEVISKFKELKK